MNQILLQEIPLFKNITDQGLELIRKDLRKQIFEAGEIIFNEDEEGPVLYILESGKVRAFVSNPNGVETSVIFCGATGDFFGELAAIDQKPRSATTIAITKTAVWKLSCNDLFKHIQSCPQLGINFIIELSSRVRYNTKRIQMFASKNIRQRLAETIVELALQLGVNQPNLEIVELAVTQEDLANLVGATRESANRGLSYFKNKEWLNIKRGQITLRNIDALQQFAQA